MSLYLTNLGFRSDSRWDFRRTSAFTKFGDLIKFIINRGKNLELVDVLVWTIWYRRNLLRTLDKSFPITQVLPNAVLAHVDFLHTLPNDFLVLNPRVSFRTMWIPPPHPMFKVNFNGVVFKEENKASIGVVIRDNLG